MSQSNIIHFSARRKAARRIKDRMLSCRFKSLESFARSIGANEEDLRVMVVFDSDQDMEAVARVLGFVAHETGLPIQKALKAWPEIRTCLKQLPRE